MKKIIISILCTGILLSFITFENKADTVSDISDKLIRFHVIANSDLDSDQEVKLKVRDAILQKYGPMLSKCSTRDESMEVIRENISGIETLADNILKKEGMNYSSKAVLGESTFPIKKYGDITLPPGQYTALKVVLGDGEGKNWWCVMFPPLCFIDITKGLTSEETDNELKKVLSDKEVDSITAFRAEARKVEVGGKAVQGNSKTEAVQAKSKDAAQSSNSHTLKPNVEFRLKSVEIFKRTLQRLSSLL